MLDRVRNLSRHGQNVVVSNEVEGTTTVKIDTSSLRAQYERLVAQEESDRPRVKPSSGNIGVLEPAA